MRTWIALALFAVAALLVLVGGSVAAAPAPLARVAGARSVTVDRLAPHAAMLTLDDATVVVVPRAALAEAVREGDRLDASLHLLPAIQVASGAEWASGRTSLGGGDRSW